MCTADAVINNDKQLVIDDIPTATNNNNQLVTFEKWLKVCLIRKDGKEKQGADITTSQELWGRVKALDWLVVFFL